MGRFYSTADPTYVDDFIYQPPWEMMDKVLAKKQQGYDNAIQSTAIVEDMLDIKHLDYDSDASKEIAAGYQAQIDDLTRSLEENPDQYSKIMPKIMKLAKDISRDRKEGNISYIEGRAAGFQKLQEDNAALKADEPETYAQYLNHYYNETKEKTAEDFTTKHSGAIGVAKPNFNSADIQALMKQTKESARDQQNGFYLIGETWLSEAEIQENVLNMVMSDPKAQQYLRQMSTLKAPGYYNEETGSALNMYGYYNAQGEEISTEEAKQLQEEYGKLSLEEKKNTPFPFKRDLNPNHGFTPGAKAWGGTLGFQKVDIKEDIVKTKAADRQSRERINHANNEASLLRTQIEQQGLYDRMMIKAQLDGQAGFEKAMLELSIMAAGTGPEAKEAQIILDRFRVDEQIVQIANKDITVEGVLDLALKGNSRGVALFDNAAAGAMDGMKGLSEYQKNFLAALTAGKKAGKTEGQIINEYVKENGDGGHKPKNKHVFAGPDMPGMTIGITSTEVAKTALEDLSKDFTKGQRKWLKNNYNSETNRTETYSLDGTAGSNISQMIKSNPESFTVLNNKGEKVTPEIIGSVQTAGGSNNAGYLVFEAGGIDGQKYTIIPKTTDFQMKVALDGYILRGLNNKNSPLIAELVTIEANDLGHALKGSGNVTRPDGTEYRAADFISTDMKGNPIKARVISEGGYLKILDGQGGYIKRNDGNPMLFRTTAEVVSHMKGI